MLLFCLLKNEQKKQMQSDLQASQEGIDDELLLTKILLLNLQVGFL